MHILFLLTLFFLYSIHISTSQINLSDYDYPKPSLEEADIYNIALLGTNDIHGAYFNETIQIPNTTDSYTSGGLQYLGKYISIMRNEWGERFAWFDSGDQFQGGIETKLTKGDLITQFYNTMHLTGATIGNHEWDYGLEYLNIRGSSSNFSYIVANVKKGSSFNFMTNQVEDMIYQIGKIKVGVVGLTTIETPTGTSGNLSDITFLPYADIIKEHSTKLRKEGANAVVLLAHFGVQCFKHSVEDKYVLKMRDSSMKFTPCSEFDELAVLLKQLPKDTVDVVISGHTHDIVHQWINDFPVIAGKNNGKYINMIYLSFKKVNGVYEIIKDQTKIEGPIPVCQKIFSKTLRCDAMRKDDFKTAGDLVEFTFHNMMMEKESTLDKISADAWEKYEKLVSRNITKINGRLYQIYEQELPLGNIVTDYLKRMTGADIAVINPGAMKSEWNSGMITAASVYTMSPFENAVTTFQMYGYQLKRMMYQLQSGKSSYYPTSGFKQVVNFQPNSLIEIKLYDGFKESEIENEKIYTIVANNFLIPYGGNDFSKIIKWYKPMNLKYWNDFTEGLIEYLSTIPEIDVDKFIDYNNQRIRRKGLPD